MASVKVPITKGGASVEFTDEMLQALPAEVFSEIILQGLKTLLNRGMSKITKSSIPDEAQRQAQAMAAAQKNLEAVQAGKIKFTGGKAKKASGAVMVEARRLAKALVKDALREAGEKISHYEAKDITAMANELIEADPSIVEQAKVNVAEREEKAKAGVKVDLSKIKASPKLVAKAEKEKAEKKTQLSAKQAGKPQAAKPKAKPTAEAAATPAG